MITGLAHICFIVKDLEASVKFYTEVLGLTEAFDYKNDQGERFGVYVHAGERTFIELFQGDPAPAAEKQSYQHFCLEVDDFDKTVEELRARGAEVSAIKRGNDQSWQAWLADPDGNRFEIHGYTDESWQVPHLK